MQITDMVQVNIPFSMLRESYLDRFITYRLNPEIGFDAIALDTWADSQMEPIARQLREAGLTVTIHAPFMDLAPGSPDPKIRAITLQRLQQVVRLIPLFKPRSVVCHTGYDERRYWPMKDLWLKNSLEIWHPVAEAIKAEGSVLVLENVYDPTPQDMLELLNPLKHYGVGFCLDTGHQSVFSTAPLDEWLTILGTHLRQLHLHDNFGEQDEHLALGNGRIDFPRLFSYLKALASPQPIITLEPHKEEDLWPSLRYLEKLWPWRPGASVSLVLH